MQTAGKKQHICVTPPFKLSVKPMEYARRSNGTSIRGSLLDYGRAVYINRKRYHVVVCVSSVGYEATGSGNRVVLCQMDMTFQTHIHYNMCACRMWRRWVDTGGLPPPTPFYVLAVCLIAQRLCITKFIGCHSRLAGLYNWQTIHHLYETPR